MPRKRLSLDTLSTIPTGNSKITMPLVDPNAITIGIVHFGIGAFHRGHQAVFTEDAAAATGDTRWGILGVTGRTDAVVKQLRPQDCLYGVLERGATETALRLIGSVRDVAWPGLESERVVETIAMPTTYIATLTITEKAYLRASDGAIDLRLADVKHDLDVIGRELLGEADLPASRNPIGLLVRGLARRYRRHGEPFTVLACDNLVGNGVVTRRLVTSLVSALGAGGDEKIRREGERMLAWLEASVTFPSTMVDRIVPSTTEEDREEAYALLGVGDEALVVAEPFRQWVIEDNFAGPRPAWENAGAILTDDVAPYERVKLRVLNSTHTMLAYLGALKGHRTIAEAVADPVLYEIVRLVLDQDVLPTLQPPAGLDLNEYRDTVLERFANPNLAYTTLQVARDGSQKLPYRILDTATDRLTAGDVPIGLALAVAAWITFIASTMVEDGPVLEDPLADVLREAVGSQDDLVSDPAAVVERVFAIDEIFPKVLRGFDDFKDAVVVQLAVVHSLIQAGSVEV